VALKKVNAKFELEIIPNALHKQAWLLGFRRRKTPSHRYDSGRYSIGPRFCEANVQRSSHIRIDSAELAEQLRGETVAVKEITFSQSGASELSKRWKQMCGVDQVVANVSYAEVVGKDEHDVGRSAACSDCPLCLDCLLLFRDAIKILVGSQE